MHQEAVDDLVLDWLRGRRSIRYYRPEPVPEALLKNLLEAAIWAPSAHNRQPWRLAIIKQSETKHRLATAMGQKFRADLNADNLPAEIIEADVSRSYDRITGAPLLVIFSISLDEMDAYPDQTRQTNEWLMAVQSTAMAGQNLLLAAHAQGLGACWMCAPLFCPEVVRQALALPGDWQPQGLVTIGYPAEQRNKDRLPLADRVNFID